MASIQDVAQRAGVSTATVSRFIRGQRVRSETAIREAIEELGYWPTAAARSLRSGVHYAIAVVVPDVTNPFFAALVKGIESVFRPGPYSVFLANTEESSEIEDAVLADIVRRVDGIILAPATEQDETPLRVREAGIPVVFVDRELSGGEFDSVTVDNFGGAHAAVTHLLSLGHERIALISGPLNTTPGRARHEGAMAALEAQGIEIPPEYRKVGDFRESGGHDSMLQLLALLQRPTAVFCANNFMTIGALKALSSMRVEVPDDMSIVGFDDLDLATLLSPPLTVVDRPTVEQGILAAHLLQTRLTDRRAGTPQRVVLPTRLIPRGSSAPVRGAPASQPASRGSNRAADVPTDLSRLDVAHTRSPGSKPHRRERERW
jgi:DNA-binding LacI/PurR family transcriptional regulator